MLIKNTSRIKGCILRSSSTKMISKKINLLIIRYKQEPRNVISPILKPNCIPVFILISSMKGIVYHHRVIKHRTSIKFQVNFFHDTLFAESTPNIISIIKSDFNRKLMKISRSDIACSFNIAKKDIPFDSVDRRVNHT